MPYDPYYSSCKLLLHFNGTNNGTVFTDSSPVNRTMTRVGSTCVTSTAQSKFGGSSYFNNGSASYLTSADTDDLDFGTDDFTIELWGRIPGSGNRTLIGRQIGNVVAPFAINVGGLNLQFWISFNNTTWANSTYLAQTALSINTWYHIALCRNSNNFRCFLNGTQVGSTYTSSSSFTNSSANLMIGSQSTGLHLNGNLDEVAIWRGVGKYTSNFTPPTSEYTNILPLSKQIISY